MDSGRKIPFHIPQMIPDFQWCKQDETEGSHLLVSSLLFGKCRECTKVQTTAVKCNIFLSLGYLLLLFEHFPVFLFPGVAQGVLVMLNERLGMHVYCSICCSVPLWFVFLSLQNNRSVFLTHFYLPKVVLTWQKTVRIKHEELSA